MARRFSTVIFLASWGVVLASSPALAAPSDEEFLKVGSLSFLGNEHFSEGELRGRIRTQTPSLLHPFRRSLYRRDFIRGDVEFLKAFYRRQGYLDVAVEDQATLDPAAHLVDVAFILNEGPRTFVRGVSYEGVTQLKAEDLARNSVLRPGDPLDPFAVAGERDRVLGLYADQGYYPRVSWTADSSGQAWQVTYKFTEGRPTHVQAVHVKGLLRNSSVVVSREMKSRPGSLLSRKDVDEDRSRLYDTDLFQAVQITADSASDTLVDLDVTVVERKPAWLEAGSGYGSHDNMRLSLEGGTRSLFWTGKRLSAGSTISLGKHEWVDNNQFEVQESRTEVSFLEPWFLRSRTRAQVTIYYQVQSDTTVPRFVRGATFLLKRDISRQTRISLSFDHRGNTPHALTYGLDTLSVGGSKTQGYTARKLEFTFEQDHRDNPFDPRRGSAHAMVADVAGGLLGGQTAFHRLGDNSSFYRPILSRNWVLAFRVRLGMITPFGRAAGDDRPGLQLLRPEDRFRTGGATSVRGYAQDEIGGQDEAAAREGAGNDPLVSLGGRFLLVSNLEVRFPLWGILSGAAFLDGGNVWRSPSDVTPRAFSPYALRGPDSFDRFRYSVGGGLRLGTPVGPFRVDYGVKLNPPEVAAGEERPRTAWHFSLGQAF